MSHGRINKPFYIGCLLLVSAIICIIVTYCVLHLASSSSSTSDQVQTHAVEANTLESTSDGIETTKENANILTIILDDAGWGDFSFHSTDPWYGLSTPNMDNLMSEGLYFSNYYTQSLCTPARGSLMTGRWTWVLGLQKRRVFLTCMDSRLSWEYPTYGELLKQRDYTNYFFGKWHLGMDSWRSTPRGRGFDHFLGSFCEGGGGMFIDGKGAWFSLYTTWACSELLADQILFTSTYTQCLMESYDFSYSKYSSETGTCFSYMASTLPVACLAWNANVPDYIKTYMLSEGEYIHLDLLQDHIDWWRDTSPEYPIMTKHSDLVLADEAMETLQNLTPDDDWSMHIAFKTPHQDGAYLPNGTNTEVVDSCAKYFDKKSKYYSYDRGAICQQMWMADGAIGEIVETLKSNGLWDSTLIIFTNDNGGATGQGINQTDEDNDWNYGINWPLRGTKASYYEGGVKTVLALSGGALPTTLRGTVNNDLHHVSDIAPTILAAAGWSDKELAVINDGNGFDGYPLFETSKASYGKHSHLWLSVPTRTSEEKYDDNDTAIVVESGLKYVTPSEWVNTYGYWGTLPVWETIGTTDDSCLDGCVWNLTGDPYETTDIIRNVNITQFLELVEHSYNSHDWTAGISFDYAGCDLCSWNQDCTTDTTIGYLGYRYYAPWIDDPTVLDLTD